MEQQQTVHLFVFDTLADWEPGFAVAGINNPEFQSQPGRYKVQTVGLTREPVKTIGGITILPDITVNELEPAQSAMLILPGGDWENQNLDAIIAKAVQFVEAGVPVAAICGATFALAQAGLLDNRRHTGNNAEYLKSSGYLGSALYQEKPAYTDDNVITASGTRPIEFAYHIFQKLELYDEPMLEGWYNLYRAG